jgi:hypothetical protein
MRASRECMLSREKTMPEASKMLPPLYPNDTKDTNQQQAAQRRRVDTFPIFDNLAVLGYTVQRKWCGGL